MITSEMLAELENSVCTRLSKKRFLHTLGVRKMARRLGEACLPNFASELEAAALLHDVTKEISAAEESSLLNEITAGFAFEDYPAVIHSYTAPIVIKREFPKFATEKILSAVEKHTLGSRDMSVFDMIIFIADYVEEGRQYTSCIETRDFLLSSIREGEYEKNIKALRSACIMAIDFTVKNLIEKNKPVNPITLAAKNALVAEN